MQTLSLNTNKMEKTETLESFGGITCKPDKRKEILIKALEKAYENGYSIKSRDRDTGLITCVHPIKFLDWNVLNIYENGAYKYIFDKRFAEAFFGTDGRISWVATTSVDWRCLDCDHKVFDCDVLSPPKEFEDDVHKGCKNGKIWQTHLQNMVLESEPLDYLKKFL